MTEVSFERSIPGFLSDIQKSTTTTKKEKKGEEDENEGSLVLVIAERRTERVTTTKKKHFCSRNKMLFCLLERAPCMIDPHAFHGVDGDVRDCVDNRPNRLPVHLSPPPLPRARRSGHRATPPAACPTALLLVHHRRQ